MDSVFSKLKQMLSFVYSLSLWQVLLLTAVIIAAFGVAGGLFGLKKQWKIICAVLFSLVFAAIIAITMVFRSQYYRGYLLVPFQRLIESQDPDDVILEMAQNAFLFVPFGTVLPFLLDGKHLKRFLATAGAALAFSITIEILQYKLSVGFAQGDDVLMNVLGAAVGFFSFLLADYISKKKKRRVKK